MATAPEIRSFQELPPPIQVKTHLSNIRDVFMRCVERNPGTSLNTLGRNAINTEEQTQLLRDFGQLAWMERRLGKKVLTKEQREVINSFKEKYQPFIQTQLKLALAEQISGHIYSKISKELKKTFKEDDQALAKMLGLDKDPDIANLFLSQTERDKRRNLRLGLGVAGSLLIPPIAGALLSNLPKRVLDSRAAQAASLSESYEDNLDLATLEPELEETSVAPTATATPTKPPATPTATATSTPKVEATATIPPTQTPTLEPTATPIPTLTPEQIAAKRIEELFAEIGDKNIAEFVLEKYLEGFKERGRHKRATNAGYAERVSEQAVESDNITFVVIGTDNERDRDKEGTPNARADVFKVVTFNPHTFQTVVVSFPRDLLSPEILALRISDWTRINTATMLPVTTKDPKPKDLISHIAEDATGLRIDGIIQTNIDFVGGYDNYIDKSGREQSGKNGLIDELVPEGLDITPKTTIDDREFPKGFGTVHVRFEKGKTYRLHGRAMKRGDLSLIQYARSRHSDSDYGRSERQSEVLGLFGIAVLQKVAMEMTEGKTETLDKAIDSLKEHRKATNFVEYDVHFIGMMEEILSKLKYIANVPGGEKVLAQLVKNSAGNIARLGGEKLGNKALDFLEGITGGAVNIERTRSFKNLGVDNLGLGTYAGAVTRLQTPLTRTPLGNYLEYWKPVRNEVKKLLAA